MTEFSESLKDEGAAFLKAHPEVRHLDAFIVDLAGNCVGKRMPAADIAKLYEVGSTLCAAMPLTDVNGIAWDTLGLGFSNGDPDAPCWPVPGTLTTVPWASEPRAQCLMTLRDPESGGALWLDPRSILESVVRRFEALGLRPVVAVELEFYLIDRDRTAEGAPQPPLSPATGQRDGLGKCYGLEVLEAFGSVMGAIEAACLAQRVPVTTLSREYGPGQFEINLAHHDDPVRAADEAVLLRRAVRQTARARGLDATFLSKPYADQSGSGLQINVSLADSAGRNAFDPSRPEGEILLGRAVAGMQALLAESFAIFAPNLNAYRRFEPNQFTPVNDAWAHNNRSAAFRIPASEPGERRIEHRAAGAEANPYLVLAAVLAAVHHGIAEGLEPSPPGRGNLGEEADPDLPLTFWHALNRLESARVLPGYLGERYPEAYVHVKRSEFESFLSKILPREYEWYL